ncbi:bifunctional DNA primase/polymerase [Georgenia sp. AZ-5]|uniref:bifunctional DNA primase/polymerase n=1 Tax=Georgenia sp. AZ-5 TaxID=3367526 RepID=UPI003754BDFB
MNHAPAPASWTPAAFARAASAPTIADAALAFARAGAAVFPCLPEGKAPLTVRGFHDASSDPRRVESWWRQSPRANIGLPTGASAGIDVVDVDVHSSGAGFGALDRARRTGLTGNWAWIVRTPSGGVHLYYPHPGGSEQRSWSTPGAHVDFRGDGGYVIAPPSRVRTVDGGVRAYELTVVAHGEPAPVNAAALRSFLLPPRPKRPAGLAPTHGSNPEHLAAWVASRPEGGRNDGLFWAACRMVEHGFDLPSTLGALGAAAQHAGLPEREAIATIRSAFRTAPFPTPVKGGGRRRPPTHEAISR